jgi:hypothetical protein
MEAAFKDFEDAQASSREIFFDATVKRSSTSTRHLRCVSRSPQGFP